MLEKLGGRKFIVAVIAFVVILLDNLLKLGIDDATKQHLIALTIGYGLVNSLSKFAEK
jgi:hypothetical protein